MTQARFNWKVFGVLWIAAVLGIVAVIPYTLTLETPVLEKTQLPIPLAVLLPIQIAQNALLLAVATGVGMFLAYRIGLGAPILEAFFAGEKVGARVRAILSPSIVLGVIASLAIIGLDVFVFVPALKTQLGTAVEPLTTASVQPPAWQGLLASFYGAIDEEILLRLLLLSLLAFLGRFVSHTADGRPSLAVLWVANVLAAILFGLGHLPATAVLVPLTPLVVVRAVVLNGLAGIAFGYLYWTRGLESAMLSHFSADIVLHVVTAL